MSSDLDLNKLYKIIKAILFSSPYGCTESEIKREYRLLNGQEVPYIRFGFKSFHQLMVSCPNVAYSKASNDIIWIYRASYDEDTKQLGQLVCGQLDRDNTRELRRAAEAQRVLSRRINFQNSFSMPSVAPEKPYNQIQYNSQQVLTQDENNNNEFILQEYPLAVDSTLIEQITDETDIRTKRLVLTLAHSANYEFRLIRINKRILLHWSQVAHMFNITKYTFFKNFNYFETKNYDFFVHLRLDENCETSKQLFYFLKEVMNFNEFESDDETCLVYVDQLLVCSKHIFNSDCSIRAQVSKLWLAIASL